MKGKKVPVAVFVSGRGSNLQALIDDTTRRGDASASVVLVVSDVPNVHALERATHANIPAFCIDESDDAVFEKKAQMLLSEYGVALICLAGFMRIVSSTFVTTWEQRILNIHPSLLPKYPGLNPYKRALAAGDTEHGCSVHYVTATLDGGPILGQRSVPIVSGDTVETLAERLLVEEHILYPEILERVACKMMCK